MAETNREKEHERLGDLADLRDDPHADKVGVLLSEEIAFYAEEADLISPFNEKHLKPAGYELSVGDEAMRGGEHISLDGVDSELKIPPFEVAVIKTKETINLPRFLIARWNIRVKWAYKGLLWVGGPQVDPGYVGNLFCPLYNLSNESVYLKKGEPIALMDFVKTTPIDNLDDFGAGKSKKYRRPPKRVLLEDFGVKEFRSALFAREKDIKDELKDVRQKVEVFSTFIFVILTILITIIALPYLNRENLKVGLGVSTWLPLAISFFAILISLFVWRSVPKQRDFGWLKLLSLALFGGLAGAAIVKYLL